MDKDPARRFEDAEKLGEAVDSVHRQLSGRNRDPGGQMPEEAPADPDALVVTNYNALVARLLAFVLFVPFLAALALYGVYGVVGEAVLSDDPLKVEHLLYFGVVLSIGSFGVYWYTRLLWRTATSLRVDANGVTVKRLFGATTHPWDPELKLYLSRETNTIKGITVAHTMVTVQLPDGRERELKATRAEVDRLDVRLKLHGQVLRARLF